MLRLLAGLVLALVCACAARPPQPSAADIPLRPTVILISLDGWRWDYETKAPAPNLRALIARGVRAANLIPTFPSKTFPNHYTIVTGLSPEHHGIVANAIKDPATGRLFTRTDVRELRDPMWWGGEPIWVTAQRGGQIGAAMFWPGSEAPIGGMLPRHWKAYDASFPGEARVDQILEWLDLPLAERPTMLTLYFSDLDSAGHDDGPESEAVREAIVRVDGYLGRLLRGLERRGMADAVNVVVLSDHGMAPVNSERVVVVDDYIDVDDVDIVDINPTLGIFPKPGKEDEIYRALRGAHSRLTVYRREETPPSWRYRSHARIPPIVGVADEGWQVLRRATLAAILALKIRGEGGDHGYDPALMSMRGLFVAAGPAFRTGATVPAFENIHVYNVLAAILGVPPAPNDGDPAIAQQLLR